MKGYFQLTISSSTAISRTALILLAFISFGCKASDAAKPKAEGIPKIVVTDTLFPRCTAESCSLFTLGKDGKEIFIDEGSRATTVRKLTSQLFRATSSCGSPCSEVLYYDSRTGKKAGFYADVLAEDTTDFLVAHMDGPTVIAKCIFPCPMKEKMFSPALGPSAAPRSAIQEAHFEHGRFILRYLKGPDFVPAVDTFLVKNP